MVNSIANVVAGRPNVTGGIYHAPMATALPADVSTALAAGYKSVGYLGEAGLVETPARTTEKKKAWGGDIIKVLQTDFSVTYKFTMVEVLSAEVAKAVHGAGNVVATPAAGAVGNLLAVKVNSDILPHERWVYEIRDGIEQLRIVVPDGQITEVGDISYVDNDVIAYQVTLEAFRDATLGANAVRYSTDGVTA